MFIICAGALASAGKDGSRGYDDKGFPRIKFVTVTGEAVDWPARNEPASLKDVFIVSKEEMAKLMTQSGFGDAESAERIYKFAHHTISDHDMEARWIVINALLGGEEDKFGPAFYLGLQRKDPGERQKYEIYGERLERFLKSIKPPTADPFSPSK
ncbi:MAG TPA: hypothetical protein VG796_06930 [Verrucomicrobiales bacterium]|nr:hypothetical protein [Verrucomicrobiales bacterium]